MTTATELATLTERLKAHMDATERWQEEASKERGEMLRAITALTASQTKLSDDMAEVKPITDRITSVSAKLAGAATLLGIIGAALWGGVLLFKEQIFDFLKGG